MSVPAPPAASWVAALALWSALALPTSRILLETEMARQMALQLPLLVTTGGLIAHALRGCEPGWLRNADRSGGLGLTVALFAVAFWMLPRSLDAALAAPGMEAAKMITVPLLAGVPLTSSWRRLPALARGFLAANLLSMLGIVGALYLAAPVRLCVYYRLDQQAAAGEGLIALAGAAGLAWLLSALVGWPRQPESIQR